MKCQAKTAKGRKCKANAVKGSKYCIFHGGKKRGRKTYRRKPRR